MINDAEWIDLNGTGKKSLVLAGEWMDVTILNSKGAEFEASAIPESSGWWKTINHTDYDGDGDQDLLVGNMGLNSKLKASKKMPLNLYLKDFDRNGKLDAVMTYYTNGKESIFSSRSVLKIQIPSIGPMFPTNKAFAEASLKDIFGDGLSKALKLTVNELRSGVFINDGNGFHFEPFPNIMQISFIQNFLIADINSDGRMDIFSAGNLLASSVQEGRYTADRGSIITGLTDNPELVSNHDLGLSLRGDVRHIKMLNFNGKELIIVVSNNDSIKWLMRKNP